MTNAADEFHSAHAALMASNPGAYIALRKAEAEGQVADPGAWENYLAAIEAVRRTSPGLWDSHIAAIAALKASPAWKAWREAEVAFFHESQQRRAAELASGDFERALAEAVAA